MSDPVKAAPLHEQVTERILKRIVLGEWPEGHVLPAETELARRFGVSYGTIRRAMSDLVKQGVVARRRRTGTVVTGRTPNHTLEHFYLYYRLHSSSGALVNTETRVIDVSTRPANDDELEQLRLAEGAEVGTILRLRLSEERPVMIDRISLPLSRVCPFPSTPEETPLLLYRWLLEEHGQRLCAVRERITARLADRHESVLLSLDPGRPHAVLEIKEVAFDASNAPLLVMQHTALTDQHCYINEIR